MKLHLITCLFIFLASPLFGQDLAYVNHEHTNETELKSQPLELNRVVRWNTCPMTNDIFESECTRRHIIEHLNETIVFPEVAQTYQLEANCKIFFEVGETGKVVKTKIQRCNEDVFGPSIESALAEIEFDPSRVSGTKQSRVIQLNVDFKLY